MLTFKYFFIIILTVIKMNSLDLRRHNSSVIFQEILSGNNTVSGISRSTGISVLTVSNLIDDMVKRELLELYKLKEDNVGRRKNRYRPSDKHFVIFIEKCENYFSVFGISANNKMLFEFNYPIDNENYSYQDALTDLIENNIKRISCYNYCLKIFVSCDNIDEFHPIDDVVFTNINHLIATAYSDNNRSQLFEINDICILSLYSHIHTTSESAENVIKLLSFDDIYTFQGNLHFEKLNSLKIIVQRLIKKLI